MLFAPYLVFGIYSSNWQRRPWINANYIWLVLFVHFHFSDWNRIRVNLCPGCLEIDCLRFSDPLAFDCSSIFSVSCLRFSDPFDCSIIFSVSFLIAMSVSCIIGTTGIRSYIAISDCRLVADVWFCFSDHFLIAGASLCLFNHFLFVGIWFCLSDCFLMPWTKGIEDLLINCRFFLGILLPAYWY